MCAGCEAVYQTATSNPSLITMIFGYVASGILLVASYILLFARKTSAKIGKAIQRTFQKLRKKYPR